MSVDTKGFITIEGEPFKALNQVVHAVVQLCSRNTILRKEAHPFRITSIEMGSASCFFIRMENSREEEGHTSRQVQIGYYEDTVDIQPKGDKIALSMGSWGDSEFVMLNMLAAAKRALGKGEIYFQLSDTNSVFTGPLHGDSPEAIMVCERLMALP